MMVLTGRRIAERGITGRRVRLHGREFAMRKNSKYLPFESHTIPLSELIEAGAIRYTNNFSSPSLSFIYISL